MLKVLLKKQLSEIFRSYFYDQKKNKARSKGAVVAYMVLFVLLLVGVLGGMFTALSLILCGPMVAVGMDWFYFALMGLLAVLLGAFGSVFNTYAGLYLGKDNDLLLSMPIPVRTIIAAPRSRRRAPRSRMRRRGPCRSVRRWPRATATASRCSLSSRRRRRRS